MEVEEGSPRPLKVLLIEDDEDDYLLTRDLLGEVERESFDLDWVATYDAALEAIRRCQHDVYLVDYRLDRQDGIELVHQAQSLGCKAPIIMLTGQGDHDIDLKAMEAGATSYLVKGRIDAPLLERTIRYAVEHARLERHLRERTQELEAANLELEAFSYSVSHDLRAPLRAMDGFSRILFEEYSSQLPEDAQRYLQLVRDSAQQMGQLIDDLLAFSRLNRQPLRKQTVAPADLVRRVLEDLHAEQEGRRVEISIADLPSCEADPALLKQVFCNLLSNALKFTRGREVTIIEVGCAEIRVSSPESGVSSQEIKSNIQHPASHERVYFVKDNGTGFDMRYADKLFGVFQRLHRAEEYEGTGVGLAIVQRIIHRHGGRIWAESEKGQGATFYFTL